MPQLHHAKLGGKTTIKMPVASLAILGSSHSSQEKLGKAQSLGKEIARQGHIVCISEMNSCTKSVVEGANLHDGMTIGYIHTESRLDEFQHNFPQLSHFVLPDSDYAQCTDMMLRSVAAVILIGDQADELRPFAQTISGSTIIGILTDASDLSHQVLDVLTISGQQVEGIIIDSSPINLIKRILKQLRQRQLLNR